MSKPHPVPRPLASFSVDALAVEVHASNEAAGAAAAAAVADAIRAIAQRQEVVRVIFATGNSQLTFNAALTRWPDVPWDRVVCFHMDEYLGIAADHPASFRRWMQERIVAAVRPRAFHLLAGDAADPETEAARYAALLREQPIDITCLGFGENGHIAFNDPPFADFDDPEAIKLVQLDERSRQQQVGEKHFPNLDAVPTHALTVTIPMLLSARHVFAIVPEKRKAGAVRSALQGPITPECPASILRRHPRARLFLDQDSASALSKIAVAGNSRSGGAEPAPAKSAALDAIVRQGFVPIFVPDQHDARKLVEAAMAAGCVAVEYSCRREDARTMIPWIKREFPHVIVLAATLVDGPRAEAFLSRHRPGFLTVDEAAGLGADGLVSFLRFRPETYEKYGSRCVMIPGVSTPNEALDQIELGADLVKVTVHTTSGREFVTKTSAPTHQCFPFFVSGGLTPDNVEEFIQSGVAVTAAGFDLLLGGARAGASELTPIARQAIARMIQIVQAAREKHQPKLAAAIRAGTRHLLAHGPWFHANPDAGILTTA